jgi:hypothetical protein
MVSGAYPSVVYFRSKCHSSVGSYFLVNIRKALTNTNENIYTYTHTYIHTHIYIHVYVYIYIYRRVIKARGFLRP